MKVYTAAFINKPLRSINLELRKKVATDLRKALHTHKNSIASQELNSFIFVSGEKHNGSYDPNLIEKVEKKTLYRRFEKYNKNNESRFRDHLQNNQELRETSQIVKNFIKEINSSLPKKLDSELKKINIELPRIFCELSTKSFITLWDIDESQQYRFYLSGFDFPVFTGNTSETPMNIGGIVDQLLIVNFFVTFLNPTIQRLDEMNAVLLRLEQEILKQHYRTDDPKLQTKFELFLRILVAKLSALQDLENLIYRIFNLFEIPRMSLTQYNLKSDLLDFNTTLARISEEIQTGKSKLHEVGELIQRCQLCIRDYLDIGVNGVLIAESAVDFKQALIPVSEISIDLFIEAEMLKIWSDYFGSDLPFFSFNAQLLNGAVDTERVRIDRDTILAVRGLFKNYNLGRTTVYAIRGVNLDIKEGEFVAIVGSSGAGKTTLLNCMASLDSPDHGVVYFRGKNLHRMKDSEKSELRLKEMGFIFQSYALLPHFNTKENVALPADLAGLSKELKKRIKGLLKGVGIDQQAKQFPAQLSGGQMQRVAIARALTNQPAVIFADEPTGDLDSMTGKQVMDLLKKFHEETKTTIIVITHEEDIAAYAERQIVMEDGVITSRG